MVDQKVGAWAFILGILIAVIVGIAVTAMGPVSMLSYGDWLMVLLIVLGLIVGFINIGDKDIQPFLIAVISLAVARGALAGLNPIAGLGSLVTNIVTYIGMFVAPAALLVALKAIYNLGRKP